ncbi:MAG: hypothetical protein WCA10_10110 [Terracidiphilus sp.]
MCTKDSLTALVERVAVLFAESRHLQSAGFHFRIVHRFHMPGSSGCLAGEEILGVFLVYHGREYCLRLSLALRILFDYLARHSRFPQSARQIELGIHADDFYQDHGKNANRGSALTRRLTRSAIRVYMERLRQALALAFQEAGMNIDPNKVLIVRETVGNEIGYQLKGSFACTHIDLTSRDAQPLRRGIAGQFGK